MGQSYEIVTIPTTSNPYRVIVNGVEYKYEAGATVEVPPKVAAAINASVNAAADLVKPGEGQPPFGASWNDLTDKPFGEIGGDTITWDGDTTGATIVDDMLVWVSEVTPTHEDTLAGYSVTDATGKTTTVTTEDAERQHSIGENWLGGNGFFVTYQDNVNADYGFTFPKKGLYLMYVPSMPAMQVLSLTIPGFTGFPTIKKIDEKFLPSNFGGSIKTAIIKQDGYDNFFNGGVVPIPPPDTVVEFTCVNMTFEEAWDIGMKGEPLSAMVMDAFSPVPTIYPAFRVLLATDTSVPHIFIEYAYERRIYWTAEGISTQEPPEPK